MEAGTSFVYDSSLMPATVSVNRRYGSLQKIARLTETKLPAEPSHFSYFVGGTSRAKDGEQEGKKSRKEEGSRIEGVRGRGKVRG